MITRIYICVMVYFVTISGLAANADTDDVEHLHTRARGSVQNEHVQRLGLPQVWAYRLGKVSGAIEYNPLLRPAKIAVEISGEKYSLVTLKGYVGSKEAKDLAEQLALSVKGVEQVHNGLIVDTEMPEKLVGGDGLSPERPEQRLSNVTISNKVKSQLLANRRTSGINIDVTTQNRVVTITGEVDSDTEKELAYWVVKNTQGVKEVVDRLDVADPEARHVSVQVPEQTVVEQQ